MPSFLKSNKKKVFILGIDGVPCSLLRGLMDDGIMPNLRELMGKGTLAPMDASIPEVSSTSWTTFMTGVNPGRHSIYGFMELKPGSYEIYFPNSSDITSNTVWDIAGKEGKRCIVINLPSTYPARPLNGILTAGFVAIDLKKATYPESAYEYLKSKDYRMDVDTKKATESLELFAEDIDITFKKRREVIHDLMRKEEWDLFIGTITETDRLHHFLWSAQEDKKHKLNGFFIDFYSQIDGLIGEIVTYCKDIPFIIISDHGFTGIKKEVYISNWLKEKGYLNFSKNPTDSLEDIAPGTRAFALDPARIYINLKGRYPLGCVKAGIEYEDLRTKLKEELLEIELDGERIIKKVFFKEELYSGPYTESAPDLVVVGSLGYDLKGSLNKNTLFGRSIFTGAHTQNDATFFINQKVEISNTMINIIDIAPLVLKLLGVKDINLEGRLFLNYDD